MPQMDFKFDKIYRRYYPALLLFVEKMIKDRARAEDIVHNIFMRLLSGKASFESEASLRNWLYVCARNEVVSTLRSRWESKVVKVQDYPEMPGLSMEEHDAEMSSAIRSALGDMPRKRAEVFRLSKIEQLPNEEVAKRLDISVRTVEKHLQLAYKDIRQKLN